MGIEIVRLEKFPGVGIMFEGECRGEMFYICIVHKPCLEAVHYTLKQQNSLFQRRFPPLFARTARSESKPPLVIRLYVR